MKSHSSIDRPADKLPGADPIIQPDEDLDKALNELSYLDEFDQSTNETCTRYIEQLEQESEQQNNGFD
ncbi:hypothetical protein [Gimesia aquarii]|uniref:Uncharacterized protein n=1 Tax=Gimesia aquarii TaxID=2527964 RepID=A0A517VTD7_9PLAN|nr:hypothetical protein [Gimesia aquarii]QDT96273.1 hypothetical protein V144x_17270 [Gimesia aquarii]QDT99893.1 hypothetical protein V144x_54070 [Gimesia aquarii]